MKTIQSDSYAIDRVLNCVETKNKGEEHEYKTGSVRTLNGYVDTHCTQHQGEFILYMEYVKDSRCYRRWVKGLETMPSDRSISIYATRFINEQF